MISRPPASAAPPPPPTAAVATLGYIPSVYAYGSHARMLSSSSGGGGGAVATGAPTAAAVASATSVPSSTTMASYAVDPSASTTAAFYLHNPIHAHNMTGMHGYMVGPGGQQCGVEQQRMMPTMQPAPGYYVLHHHHPQQQQAPPPQLVQQPPPQQQQQQPPQNHQMLQLLHQQAQENLIQQQQSMHFQMHEDKPLVQHVLQQQAVAQVVQAHLPPPPPPQQTTSASDSCSQIAHVLQCYQQGGEDPDFVRKAIESLVKKLKDKRVELDALITAVTSNGKTPTTCVTIQRSLDGRLQVAGRKGVPHVVYARIWRWPNVNKNELQKLSMCQISADNQDFICINPYHYERVVSSTIGNLEIGNLKMDTMGGGGPQSVGGPVGGSAPGGQPIPAGFCKTEFFTGTSPPSSVGPPQQPFSFEAQAGPYGDSPWMNSASASCAMDSSGPPSSMGTASGSTVVSRSPEDLYSQANSSFTTDMRFAGAAVASPVDLGRVQIPKTNLPDNWCSVVYYELDTQIGETFKVRRDQIEVRIDGGMDPYGEMQARFCLGALPNVHRSEASEKARLNIGRGVMLHLLADWRVELRAQSQKPVFVQSYFLDWVRQVPYGTVVHRFTNETPPTVVFDLRWAYAEMVEHTQHANRAARAQAAAVAGYSTVAGASFSDLMGSGVDDLRRMFCCVGISFVKGWGVGYNRQTIKDTPCWVEVQLHRPLQLLDHLLKGST